MSPAEYCRDKAAPPGSLLYYSLLYTPQPERDAITALHALRRDLLDVPDKCSDPSVARMKLNWWREELQRALGGRAQHPVTQVLLPLTRSYNLPLEQFLEIADGVQMGLDAMHYNSFKELLLYCHRVSSMVTLMSVEILGYSERATLKFANELGTALQLMRFIMDLRQDVRRGRIFIPLDEMNRFGVNINDLKEAAPGGKLKELLRFQAQRVREYHARALAQLPAVDHYRQLPLLTEAWLHLALLDKLEDRDYQLPEQRLALAPLRQLWIAWRTMRRERSESAGC
jgi:phytoene synthase